MDLGQRILLLTSLGQIAQIRLWVPELNYPLPPDIGIRVLRKDDGDVLHLMNLDQDLYSRLSQFVDFLKTTKIIEESLITFEADYDSNIIFQDKSIIFSIMMTSNGQVIMTYHSAGDDPSLEGILNEEWEKRIAVFDT